MQVEEIVKEAFLREWNSLALEERPIKLRSLIPLSNEVQKTIAEQFNFKQMRQQLLLEEDKKGKMFNERYHRRNLQILARKFADNLFTTSKGGKNLEIEHIYIAKRMLLQEGKCHTYPCGK